MAWTARSEDEKKEYFDSPEELEKKVSRLAEWVKESKHMIIFTGAGISTAAGIPDFRSGMNTKVETGPGAWELRAHGAKRPASHRVVSTAKAIPTATHMMFVKLHQEGIVKAVVSQNCDGLHRRSGLPTTGLFELHGNSNVEKCAKCKHEYLRDYRVVGLRNHETGNVCDDPKCGGKLRDTIINFGENLPEDTLDMSFDHGGKADLCLAMGSSLTVTPAANIPEMVGRGGKRLVIVNLQATPLDYACKLRIFAKCDEVSKMLMSKLGLEIPEFRLKRRVVVKTVTESGKVKVTVEGRDAEGLPFAFIKSIEFKVGGQTVEKQTFNPRAPFQCQVPGSPGKLVVTLGFHSHYGEPQLDIPVAANDAEMEASLEYNPFTQGWAVQRLDGDATGLIARLQAAKV